MDKFLGHSIGYWIKLNSQARSLGIDKYIEEIVELRGKIHFYESRLREMAKILPKETEYKDPTLQTEEAMTANHQEDTDMEARLDDTQTDDINSDNY